MHRILSNSVTRESSGGDTKAVKESAYDVETEVDELVGKVIKRSKSYNIASHKTSILYFWSTSVKDILEDGQCINMVFYHSNDNVIIYVGVRTHVALSISRCNQIPSMTFKYFYS